MRIIERMHKLIKEKLEEISMCKASRELVPRLIHGRRCGAAIVKNSVLGAYRIHLCPPFVVAVRCIEGIER